MRMDDPGLPTAVSMQTPRTDRGRLVCVLEGPVPNSRDVHYTDACILWAGPTSSGPVQSLRPAER